MSSDDDGDDDDNAMYTVHSMSSDDMHATVDFVDIIQDRTEALLNQQSFDTTLKEACVLYVCNEVCHILNLSKDEVYTPSSNIIQHLLRWTTISVNDYDQ